MTTTQYMKFNINSVVKVRLTEEGKLYHKKQWEDLVNKYGFVDAKREYQPPVEDSEGYIKFQMWELMKMFGTEVGLARKLMFATDILIDNSDLELV